MFVEFSPSTDVHVLHLQFFSGDGETGKLRMARPQVWDNFTAFCESYKKTHVVDSIIKEQTTFFPFLKFLYPIALVTFLTSFFQLILKPFGQVAFISQILVSLYSYLFIYCYYIYTA